MAFRLARRTQIMMLMAPTCDLGPVFGNLPPGGPHQQSRQSRGNRPGRPGGSLGAEIPIMRGTATHDDAILPQIKSAS